MHSDLNQNAAVARGLLKVLPGHPYLELSRLPGRAAVVVFLAGVAATIALAVRGRLAGSAASGADRLELLAVVAIATPAGAILYSLGPESVFLPRNLPHAFRSVGGPVTALLIVTPGGLDSYFAELHAAMRSNADPAEVKRIQDAYGIVRS